MTNTTGQIVNYTDFNAPIATSLTQILRATLIGLNDNRDHSTNNFGFRNSFSIPSGTGGLCQTLYVADGAQVIDTVGAPIKISLLNPTFNPPFPPDNMFPVVVKLALVTLDKPVSNQPNPYVVPYGPNGLQYDKRSFLEVLATAGNDLTKIGDSDYKIITGSIPIRKFLVVKTVEFSVGERLHTKCVQLVRSGMAISTMMNNYTSLADGDSIVLVVSVTTNTGANSADPSGPGILIYADFDCILAVQDGNSGSLTNILNEKTEKQVLNFTPKRSN